MPKPRRTQEQQALEGPAVRGRPLQTYDPQIGELVLEEMAKGQKSLRAICEENGFPDRSVIFRWVLESRDFAAKFNAARELQIHGFVDDMVLLTDNATPAQLPKINAMIKARQWYASKLMPKVYGEHLNVEQNITESPLPAGVYGKLLPEEREQLRSILTRAMQRTEDERQDGLVIDQPPIRGRNSA